MLAPKAEKKVKGFLGKIQYISYLISQLASIFEPIFKLLRKDSNQVWNDQWQKVFKKIKRYLSKPSVIMPLQPDLPLLMYLIVTDAAIGTMLAQYI